MTGRVWLLLAWVLVGAAVLVAHAAVLWQLRGSELDWRARLAALLVPPLAPVLAWRAGRRASPIAWALLVITYVVLRLLE